MISQHSTSLKEKNRRYFQKYDEKFLEIITSWKRARKYPGSKPPRLPRKATIMRLLSTPTSSQALPPPQLQYGTMSREYRSFRYNSSLLRDIIGAQIPILWLAQEMWSKSLITHQVLEEVTHSSGPLLKHKQLLLDALHSQISTNAAHFHVFLEILHKEPALEDCCKQLESFSGKNSQSHKHVNKYALQMF